MDHDYPAAHSMDTTWFAVDRDGQVATFETGENGPVPEGATAAGPILQALRDTGDRERLAAWEKEWGDRLPYEAQQFVLDEVRATRPAGGLVIDLASCLHLIYGSYYGLNLVTPEGQDSSAPVQDIRRLYLGPVLVLLDDLAVVRGDLDRGAARLMAQVPGGPPWAVWFANLTRADARRLLTSGACLSCSTLADPFGGALPPPETDLATRLGMFDYTYPDGATGAYVRRFLPALPLHVDQLSPVARAIVSRARFDRARFSDGPFFPVVAHAACHGWGGPWNLAYLDADGHTWRPMPGHEAAFDPPGIGPDDRAQLDRQRQEQRAALAAWPEEATDLWVEALTAQIEAYRLANPSPFVPDLVRVDLDMGSPERALEALAAAGGEGRGVPVRGSRFVLLDRGWNAWDLGHADPLPFYQWMGLQLGAGRWPAPAVTLGRPCGRPPLEEFHRLEAELADLAARFPEVQADRAEAAAKARLWRAWSPARCAEGAVATVLAIARAHADQFRERDHFRYGINTQHHLKILTGLAPGITEVTPAQGDWLRRLAAFLHLIAEVQRVRLRFLAVLNRQGLITRAAAAQALLSLFEEREGDLFWDDQADLLEAAVAEEGLPTAVLGHRVRVLRVEAERRGDQPLVGRCQALLAALGEGP